MAETRGRKRKFAEPRSNRTIRITDASWARLLEIAEILDCGGASELCELIGREELIVIDPSQPY